MRQWCASGALTPNRVWRPGWRGGSGGIRVIAANHRLRLCRTDRRLGRLIGKPQGLRHAERL